ncbi:MAG: hypothetical protein CMI32_07335 [Opitutales bacterium]|nr:hypothetical protein [Opitutales bacterium]
MTTDGKRYVTDKAFAPYGGSFPENWVLDRKPLSRSPVNLLKLHSERMEASGKEFLARKDLPLDDVKEKNRLFKKTNEEQDILNPQTKWKKKASFPRR